MKKVIDVNIGRINFAMDDDAYIKLKSYLTNYEASLPKLEASEIMEDIEIRVAELLEKDIKYPTQVIGLTSVEYVIECLGAPEANYDNQQHQKINNTKMENDSKVNKGLYRNPDDHKIAGVCSGIAAYFDLDVSLIRVIFVLTLLLGLGSPILIYIILWIVMPEAKTVSQKLEMFGKPVTAENIKNYTSYYEKK